MRYLLIALSFLFVACSTKDNNKQKEAITAPQGEEEEFSAAYQPLIGTWEVQEITYAGGEAWQDSIFIFTDSAELIIWHSDSKVGFCRHAGWNLNKINDYSIQGLSFGESCNNPAWEANEPRFFWYNRQGDVMQFGWKATFQSLVYDKESFLVLVRRKE